MEFSRQEYWSGLPFSSPGDLPNPGIEPGPPALQADSSLFEPPGKLKVPCRYLREKYKALPASIWRWSVQLNTGNFTKFTSSVDFGMGLAACLELTEK